MSRSKLGFFLFLGTLGVFFASSLVVYLVISWQANTSVEASEGSYSAATIAAGYKPLEIPDTLWVSTIFLVAVSVLLHQASRSVHRERLQNCRRYLVLAFLSAVVFLAIQYLGMHALLEAHLSVTDGSMKLYGLSFTFSMIHALHVLGGMAFLGYVMANCFRGKYDHEQHAPVDNCASYWHFLDVVWACMLVSYMLT